MSMEELNKSLDLIIDELFTEDESVEKSMIQDMKPEEETADEAMKKVPSSEDDKKRNAGRPKEISDVPKTDEDGSRAGNYDSDVVEKNEDGKSPEQAQVKPTAEMMKKAWEETSEYKEYVALKKAKEAAEQAENLKKAKAEQMDLIKSAVKEATSQISKENEELRDLIKSMANKPQKSKAITSVLAVEKFEKSQSAASFSKMDLLDAAEDLAKSGKIEDTAVIELEQTGFISNPETRRVLENEMKRRK